MESFGLSYNKVDYIGWLYLTTCLDKQDEIKKRRYIWNYSSLKQQALKHTGISLWAKVMKLRQWKRFHWEFTQAFAMR